METEVIWKPIPGYPFHEASSDGFIRRIDCQSRILKGSKSRTTKGHYLAILIADDQGFVRYIGIHRLVCLAFHPLPKDADKVKYEPNHKDGDKLNNCAKNLEWVSRSQNVLHAFESGMCQVGVRVKAKNIKTGEILHYNSLSAAARAFDLPRAELRNIIARHQKIPYDCQWVFDVDTTSDRKLKRHQSRSVMVKDYVSGAVTIYRDSAEANDATGVKLLTINGRVSPYSKINNKTNLLAGYVFKSLDDKTDWPSYTKEQAELSRKHYFSGKKSLPMKVTDTFSGEVKIYLHRKEFAKKLGISDTALIRPLKEKLLYRKRYILQYP